MAPRREAARPSRGEPHGPGSCAVSSEHVVQQNAENWLSCDVQELILTRLCKSPTAGSEEGSCPELEIARLCDTVSGTLRVDFRGNKCSSWLIDVAMGGNV